MPRLPARCEEAPRRRAEGLGEDALSALDGASSLFGIQTVHLVGAPGEHRDRPPASLALMEVAVKEKLLGALPDQPAVVGMRCEWPLAVPVGNHAEGETTPEKGCEVPDHHPRLTRVGRRGVVDTEMEAPLPFERRSVILRSSGRLRIADRERQKPERRQRDRPR